MAKKPLKDREADLARHLAARGTRSGTLTLNGVTYTDLNEVEWRRENNDWTTPRPQEARDGQ